MTTTYEIEGWGTIPDQDNPAWDRKGPPFSYAFVCCTPGHDGGHVWARRIVDSQPRVPFLCYTIPCVLHPNGNQGPPGSIWSALTKQDVDALPQPILERELHLHLDYFEDLP